MIKIRQIESAAGGRPIPTVDRSGWLDLSDKEQQEISKYYRDMVQAESSDARSRNYRGIQGEDYAQRAEWRPGRRSY